MTKTVSHLSTRVSRRKKAEKAIQELNEQREEIAEAAFNEQLSKMENPQPTEARKEACLQIHSAKWQIRPKFQGRRRLVAASECEAYDQI